MGTDLSLIILESRTDWNMDSSFAGMTIFYEIVKDEKVD